MPKSLPTSSSATIASTRSPGSLDALARERRERDGRGGDVALHVERAATPDLAVDEVARPRVALPLVRDRRGPCRYGRSASSDGPSPPGQPRDEVRPLRRPLATSSHAMPLRGEVVAQQLGGARLVARRVDRVEPEELLQELRHLRRGRLTALLRLGERRQLVPRLPELREADVVR